MRLEDEDEEEDVGSGKGKRGNPSDEIDGIEAGAFLQASMVAAYMEGESSFSCPHMANEVRRKAAALILKLIQGTDTSLKTLCQCHLPGPIPLPILVAWRMHLRQVASKDDVGSMIDLFKDLSEFFFNEDSHVIRTSFLGFFLRRLFLAFDKLNFHEVSRLFFDFQHYISTDSHALDNLTASDDADIVARHKSDNVEEGFFSRKQAELYIAKQVDLLQSNEHSADPPEVIDASVKCILDAAGDGDVPEAHFLAHLNRLRIRDFDGASKELTLGVDPKDTARRVRRLKHPHFPEKDSDFAEYLGHNVNTDWANKGVRYSALNLASLHARFGHHDLAMCALKEAITLAQEADDHLCLLHALGWLLRIGGDDDTTALQLVENLTSKSEDAGSDYLLGLGLLLKARLDALKGMTPAKVFNLLTKSDLLSDDSQNDAMRTRSLSQSALVQRGGTWTLYGRPALASLAAQLALAHGGLDKVDESSVLALCTLIRRFNDTGHRVACDRLSDFSSKIFRNPWLAEGLILQKCMAEVAFLRALHRTDWSEAERRVSDIRALESAAAGGGLEKSQVGEFAFWSLQVSLWRGDAKAMYNQLKELEGKKASSPLDEARMLLYRVEWYCLSNNYPGAMQPLLACLELTAHHHMDHLNAVAKMHVAHVQLHLRLPLDAAATLADCLPLLLASGCAYEAGRGRLLAAKCCAAAAEEAHISGDALNRRRGLQLAVEHLERAEESFAAVDSRARVKDVLYMKARVYHALEMPVKRNQTAAEFRKLEEQYPTNGTSRLAQML